MRRVRPLVIVPILVCCAGELLTARAPSEAGTTSIAAMRTIYFSARDERGTPVTDLTEPELFLSVGSEDRPTVRVGPATAPMDIAILVGDDDRLPVVPMLAEFLQSMLAYGRFSIRAFNHQPMKLVDFTDDPTALRSALMQLGSLTPSPFAPRSTNFPDVISETAADLRKQQPVRPVIIVVAPGAEDVEISGEDAAVADATLTAIRKSRATFDLVLSRYSTRGHLFADGPEQSGGTIEYLDGPGLKNIREMLLSQYELTYRVPAPEKDDMGLLLRTSRPGVKLTFPTAAAK